MDTVVYFYITKEKIDFCVEKHRTREYILVRAGLPKQWLAAWESSYGTTENEDNGKISATGKMTIKSLWEYIPQPFRIRQKKENEKGLLYGLLHKTQKKKQEYSIQQVLQNQMKALSEEICKKVDYPNECLFLFSRELEASQTANSPEIRNFNREWEKHTGYLKMRHQDWVKGPWVEEQVTGGKFTDYCILGYRWELLRPLWKKAARLRNLDWYLTGRQWTKEVREFVEELEWEYGLLTNVHILDSPKEYEKIRWYVTKPVKVIDATGKTNVRVTGLPRGSVYEDMYSVGDKERRIQEKGIPITYCSMEKRWRQWQKIDDRWQNSGGQWPK